jgi:hypothetical protein
MLRESSLRWIRSYLKWKKTVHVYEHVHVNVYVYVHMFVDIDVDVYVLVDGSLPLLTNENQFTAENNRMQSPSSFCISSLAPDPVLKSISLARLLIDSSTGAQRLCPASSKLIILPPHVFAVSFEHLRADLPAFS